MDVNREFGEVYVHTCHCVSNEDSTADVIVCGGCDWSFQLQPIICSFRLGNIVINCYIYVYLIHMASVTIQDSPIATLLSPITIIVYFKKPFVGVRVVACGWGA